MVRLDCSAAQLIDDLAFAASTLEEIRGSYELDAELAALVDTATDRLWNIAHLVSEPFTAPESLSPPFVH